MRLNISTNLISHFPRDGSETCGIVCQMLGTRNMCVEDMTAKLTWENDVCVITQYGCTSNGMMRTLLTS